MPRITGSATWKRQAAVGLFATGALVVVGAITASARQGVLPVIEERHHRVTFQNDVVRIIDVAIPAGVTTDYHEHTIDNITVAVTTASVTLQRQGGAPVVITVDAGGAVFTGAPEPYVHRVANVGTSAIDLVTVELMRPAKGAVGARPAATSANGVLVDNDRVRARRVTLAAGETSAEPLMGPAVRVIVSAGTIAEDGRRYDAKAAETQWVEAGRRSTIANAGTAPLTYVDIVLVPAAPVRQPSTVTTYELPPDTLARAEALYRTRLAMLGVGTVYGFGVLVALLFLRVAPRFRDLAERVSGRRFVQALVFAPAFLLTLDVLSLPVSLYGHSLDRRYGLSVQSWGSWFWDWSKGELIGTTIATLLIWGLYAMLRRSPRRWWFYGWLGMIPVILLLVLIGPIYISPLFDTFTALESKQPALVPELEKVLARGGVAIERSRMFEMAASDKVTTYNAYVTGIGASKRVVVWDNTSRDLAVPETMFVFGHEMGHYVLQHVWLSLAASMFGLLVALYVAHRLLGGLLARFGERWQVRDVSDWASFPVLLLLLSVFSLVTKPVGAAYSRYLEHQADIYGLEVLHGLVPDASQAAAHAFQKLGEKGLVYPTPHPLYVWWAFSHPPIGERIRFAVEYRPWDRGEPRRYVQ